MGNQQPKKLTKATKGQIDIACLKAKIHLELCRDRKHQDIIKGQKQLVAKIRSKNRNKVQQILIAERVVNGLKYAQACNLLMSCAATLRGHALFLADNQDKIDKMEPWLPLIYSLIYGADHLGLSSLNEFKTLMKALNDPAAVPVFTNPEILQLLTPSPTPQELNVYVLEMSERNAISLEEINMVGHKFTKDYKSPEQIQMEKQLAEELSKNFNKQQQWGEGNQGFNGGQGQSQGFNGGQGQGQGFNGGQGQGFNGGNSGFKGGQGFNGGQGGFNGGQGGFNGGQGGFSGGQGGFNGGQGGYNGGQGGFNGGQGGFNGGNAGHSGFGGGGYNQNNFNPYSQHEPPSNVNPYLSGKSNIDVGPKFQEIGTINKVNNQKPRQFPSYEDIIGIKEDPNKGPVYPSIDPGKISIMAYKPYDSKGNIANPFERQPVTTVNNHGQPSNSPTISQILRDFK